MTHRRQNFMGGAAILAGAVAVTKLLGALYKIPLGNLLDREGMAHFYAAYNIYSLLLVLSTAGLPLALSRLVSRAAAQGVGLGVGDAGQVYALVVKQHRAAVGLFQKVQAAQHRCFSASAGA